MRVIGIDIGSYSVKVAELSGKGTNINIGSLNTYPLSQNPGTDRDLDLITVLKEISQSYHGADTVFCVGISQNKSSIRSLFFPFKEKFKILKSLPFELEDQTPISAMEGVFDAKVIRTMPHGSDVLGAAIPKNHIKKTLSLFSDVGIDPTFIGLEGFAINNLFEDIFEPPPHESNALIDDITEENDESSKDDTADKVISKTNYKDGEAILDIGHSSSTLVIRSQSTLISMRQINWGAKNLIHAIAQEYNILEKEAHQRLLASKGILLKKQDGSQEDQKLSTLLGSEIEELGRVLKLSLLEAKGGHNVEVKGIGLIGGLSALKNIGAKLTEQCLVATNRVLKIKNYPELNLSDLNSKESTMAVAIGLALEAFKRPSNPPINFRRGEFKKENTALIKFWNDWGFYINLTAASLVIFFIYAQMRSTMAEDLSYQARSNMRKAAEAVFKIKQYNASETKLNKIFNELEIREKTKEKIIATTKNFKNTPLTKLKKISEKAASRTSFPVDIKNFSLNGTQIQIQGETTSKQGLDRFTSNLASIAVGRVNKSERPLDGQKISFTISFKPKKEL